MKRKVTIVLIALASGYLLLCVLLWFMQDYILFPGALREAVQITPPPGVRIQELSLADGTRYRTAVFEVDKPRGVLVYFVGNGEDLRSGVEHAAMFGAYGLQTIVTEYPGYGESGGSPSHKSILAAAERSAREAAAWCKQKSVPLFLGGHSLGSFGAVHVATLGLGERMVLISPPTSVAASGAARYPFLPIGLLLRHPFDNLGPAPSIRIPTMIIHGDQDSIVPFAMGEQLAAAIPDARLVPAVGEGHNSVLLHHGGPFAAAIEEHLFE